jgi:hypothetical protein
MQLPVHRLQHRPVHGVGSHVLALGSAVVPAGQAMSVTSVHAPVVVLQQAVGTHGVGAQE